MVVQQTSNGGGATSVSLFIIKKTNSQTSLEDIDCDTLVSGEPNKPRLAGSSARPFTVGTVVVEKTLEVQLLGLQSG